MKTRSDQLYSTDQLDDLQTLSPLGRTLVSIREKVIRAWEMRVRTEIWHAQVLPHPILIDTLPAFLDNLAEALSPHHPRWRASSATTLAQEHGGERARLTSFSPDQIVREYQILRQVVVRELRSATELRDAEVEVINASIDTALAEAVMAYAVTESSIRDQLISALSEDVKAPIEATRMFVDLIISELDHPEEISRLVARARLNLENAEHLIQDLTDMAVVRSGQKLELKHSQFELQRLVDEIAQRLRERGEDVEVSGTEIVGYWDRAALSRAIENAMLSARRFKTGGAPLRCELKEAHGRAIVSIHQEGHTIPKEEQESLFQVYRRRIKGSEDELTKKNKDWSFGLPVARALIEAHGGTLICDSVEGRGTTHFFDVPVDSRPFKGAPLTDPPVDYQ